MKLITLPGLWDKFELNTLFISYCQQYPQHLKEKIYFTVYGSFPQDSWAGHRVYSSPYALYRTIGEVLDRYNQLNTTCRFDCSNLLFDPKDFNVFGRTTLEIGQSGSNQIEISTPTAYSYLKETYPYYTFVGSENLLDFNNMDLFAVVRNSNNTILPKKFPKAKIEKIINYPCDKCSLEQWSACVASEQANITSFSNKTAYLCNGYCNNIHIVPEVNIEEYSRIQLADYGQNLTRQLEEYLKALIKPEFIDEARMYVSMNLRKE